MNKVFKDPVRFPVTQTGIAPVRSPVHRKSIEKSPPLSYDNSTEGVIRTFETVLEV